MRQAAPTTSSEHAYGIDRLIVLVAAALIIVPLVAYSWVAVEADNSIRIDLALDRNFRTAQIVARLMDQQCLIILSTLHQFGGQPSLNSSLLERDTARMKQLLRQAAEALPSVVYVAAYDARGELLAGYPGSEKPSASVRRVAWFRKLADSRQQYACAVVRPHNPDQDVILLASPMRALTPQPLLPRAGEGVVAGYLLACYPLSDMDRWLAQAESGAGVLYITNGEGRVVAANRRLRNRYLPLNGYLPVRLALSGQSGSLPARSPDGQEDLLTGFAYAKTPHCAVVASQPLQAAFLPTTYLIRRLALLLIPVWALAVGWAWNRLRFAHRMVDLARQLASQNEGLRAADKAKSDFLANASHDLRTPLACMQISLSGLLDPKMKWSTKQVRDSLLTVNGEVEQLTTRVRNLLDMTRLETGADPLRLEPCDLTAIVASALERVRPLTSGREIQADFPQEALLVECDQQQIETVVLNLVENAVKYSPEGSPLRLWARAEDGRAVFRLRDRSKGIPPGDEQRIFEKFYRAADVRTIQGSGLGLAICKAVVEAHGGKIAARTGPDGGAELTFALPLLIIESEDLPPGRDTSGRDESRQSKIENRKSPIEKSLR